MELVSFCLLGDTCAVGKAGLWGVFAQIVKGIRLWRILFKKSFRLYFYICRGKIQIYLLSNLFFFPHWVNASWLFLFGFTDRYLEVVSSYPNNPKTFFSFSFLFCGFPSWYQFFFNVSLSLLINYYLLVWKFILVFIFWEKTILSSWV